MRKKYKYLLAIPIATISVYLGAMALLFGFAAAGYTLPQLSLGSMYYQGYGVPQNPETAFYWYNRASKQAAPEGQYLTAIMYLNGEGIDQNTEKAKTLLTASAKNGFGLSQLLLGQVLALEPDVYSRNTLAYSYLLLAEGNGVPGASEILSQLVENMTPLQISEGRAIAESF